MNEIRERLLVILRVLLAIVMVLAYFMLWIFLFDAIYWIITGKAVSTRMWDIIMKMEIK